MGISERGEQLKTQVLETAPSISSERAEIITKCYQKLEYEPPIIKRAKALESILDQKTLYILDGELIVGNQAPRPRCAQVFPEFSTKWILDELEEFERRDSDIFLIDEETKRRLREILPWWEGRSTEDKARILLSPPSYRAHQEMVYILTSLSSGIGHIAVDYERCIRNGLRSIMMQAVELSQKIGADDDEAVAKRSFYRAVEIVCNAAIRFAHRFAVFARERSALEHDPVRKRELDEIARICSRVPEFSAETFHEALQSFWFVHLILQLESNGHSISPGRFDQYLYPFYEKDLGMGRITREEAKELLENVWIKMNEIIKLRDRTGSKAFGGYPMFQNLIVGGINEDGKDATNDLSYLCMEVTRDLKLPQPSFSVRWNLGVDREYMCAAAEIVKAGFGMPAFFNDEVIVPMLLSIGYSLGEAREYAEVGCVEPQAAGTTEGYYPAGFLNLAKVLEITLHNGINPVSGNRLGLETGEDFGTFESFYNAYLQQLDYFCDLQVDAVNCIDSIHARYAPTPFCSCFVDDCIKTGRDIRQGGARHNFSSPNVVGLANVADALALMKYAIFDDRLMNYRELIGILSKNYEGIEHMRQRFLNGYPKYGNDCDEVDTFAKDLAAYLSDRFRRQKNIRGGRFQVGLQSISAHALFANSVGATPDGRKKEELLADGGCSPAQGRDRKGPTAVVRSVAKMDHYRIPNGTLLNVKLHPSLLESKEGVESLISLIETYFMMKGQHIQFNVVSTKTLREAQEHPERFKDLVVRVAGFSAYFVTLDRMLQEDIIHRTEHMGF